MLWLLLSFALVAGRTYHPISVEDLAKENPGHWRKAATHVEVIGYLTYKKREEDGDWHLRLCSAKYVVGMDRKACVVAECIPELPCKVPPLGTRVKVRGIYRFDDESGHGWSEVHPVEGIEVLP